MVTGTAIRSYENDGIDARGDYEVWKIYDTRDNGYHHVRVYEEFSVCLGCKSRECAHCHAAEREYR